MKARFRTKLKLIWLILRDKSVMYRMNLTWSRDDLANGISFPKKGGEGYITCNSFDCNGKKGELILDTAKEGE